MQSSMSLREQYQEVVKRLFIVLQCQISAYVGLLVNIEHLAHNQTS